MDRLDLASEFVWKSIRCVDDQSGKEDEWRQKTYKIITGTGKPNSWMDEMVQWKSTWATYVEVTRE